MADKCSECGFDRVVCQGDHQAIQDDEGATLAVPRAVGVAWHVDGLLGQLLNLWAEIQELTTHVICHPADEAIVREALEDWSAPTAASPFVKIHVRPQSRRGEILVLQPGEMVGGPGHVHAVDRKHSPMMN